MHSFLSLAPTLPARAVLTVCALALQVLIVQPLLYIKNCVQRGVKPSFNPLVMYRGVLM